MTPQRGASGPPVAPRRVFLSSLSHVTDRHLKRMLGLAGYAPRLGWPGPEDFVALWGDRRTAARGRRLAARSGAAPLYLEDGFLRSVLPGRQHKPLSLIIDRGGAYFDANAETDLERLLRDEPLDESSELRRAADLIETLRAAGVSKYNASAGSVPPPGFVLVVDQTRDDRSIIGANATAESFAAMLRAARADHPDRRIVVQQHPETAMGRKPGHFPARLEGIDVLTRPAPPYALLTAAHAVYTVSSQLGFEAILAGHTPVVFGQPFYAGWGLTDDRAAPLTRRGRALSPAQMAIGVLIRYPVYYDPYGDCLTSPEGVLRALQAQARAYAEDAQGYHAVGMRLWKRRSITQFFADGPVRFVGPHASTPPSGPPVLCWGTAPTGTTEARVLSVEDGFIRSRGLGAQLVPALSLVRDCAGIYYDPSAPSDLEAHILRSPALPPSALARAASLRARLRAERVTKYNLPNAAAPAPKDDRRRVLVIGQVEDDASVLKGAIGSVRTNTHLLEAARAAHPDAHLVYKPHPDVEAGLRDGKMPETADSIARTADPIALLGSVDAVWTITSLMGFEALIWGKPVTTCGLPFYAGWGLTTDLAPHGHTAFARRSAAKGRVTLDGLIHACLIDYPRYRDPVTGLACPVEVILDRLRQGAVPDRGPALSILAKLQGVCAGQSWLWR